MTDILFHEVPDAQVILRSKGVYRQAKVFRRGSDIYAAWGSGFIRLMSGSGTTVPTVVWDGLVQAATEIGEERGRPVWKGES